MIRTRVTTALGGAAAATVTALTGEMAPLPGEVMVRGRRSRVGTAGKRRDDEAVDAAGPATLITPIKASLVFGSH